MYHTIIIVGNLGKDPEMRYTPSGQPVTSFNVATSRQYTGSSRPRMSKKPSGSAFQPGANMAETCNTYLKKGSKVLVEGRLTPDQASGGPRTFTRQDGTTGLPTMSWPPHVRFLSSRAEGGGTPDEAAAPAEGGEEIPF